MKTLLIWILLAMFYFITINARTVIKTLSFDGCKNDSWRVTDISLAPDGDKVNVVADIANGHKPANLIKKVRLTLTGCSENFKCTNYTNVVVGDLQCGTNGTQLDKEACDVAESFAEWKLETGELKENGTMKHFDGGCIHHDAKLVDPEVIDKAVNETKKADHRDVIELAERVSQLNFTSVV